MRMALGAKIRQAREARGWLQHELAEAVGVEPPTVSRWETDEMRPRPKKLVKIAELLDRPIEWFDGIESDRLSNLETRLEQIENFSQANPVPREISVAWQKAEEWQRDLARFFLTGNQQYLKSVKKEVRENILAALRFHKLSPSSKASQK